MRYSRKQQKIAQKSPEAVLHLHDNLMWCTTEGPVDSPPFYGKNILQPPNAALIICWAYARI